MKIRKNLLVFVLILTLSFVLAACGNNPSADTSSESDETEAVTETLQTEEPAEDVGGKPAGELEATEPETVETDANGGNVLIAYFSHTGNTKEAAQMIAEYTDGTLAEIQRTEEYGDLQEEAEVEILNGIHPEITMSVNSVSEYDTIFVGYAPFGGTKPRL